MVEILPIYLEKRGTKRQRKGKENKNYKKRKKRVKEKRKNLKEGNWLLSARFFKSWLLVLWCSWRCEIPGFFQWS